MEASLAENKLLYMLQYTTIHCNRASCNTLQRLVQFICGTSLANTHGTSYAQYLKASFAQNKLNHTLQQTATYCNILQHTATYCDILQHTATYCNILQHTATYCNMLQHAATYCNILQHGTLQHTAKSCAVYLPQMSTVLRSKKSDLSDVGVRAYHEHTTSIAQVA